MLFNSFEFLIFLPLGFLLFSSLKNKKLVVLLLSYLFYMYWNPIYIFLILFSTIVDFNIAQKIENEPYVFTQKLWLSLSVFLNLGVLFVFKYFNFFALATDNYNLVIDVLLPVGISFYTFQTIGYSIDVFRKRLKAETNFVNFSLFVCYFPQLVAGPIEKAEKLIPSIKRLNEKSLQVDAVAVEKIFVGFFKKVVIADRLAIYINHIYSSSSVSSLDILLVFYLFAIQIYCDFSGYCDIAVGISRVFGIDLTENFKQPYYSASIKEFWSRWHITLSFWFRDYLYIPLGGKFGVLKGSLNLFLVFLLSGLWHGANWTFVFWGAIHGVIILIEKHINPFRKLPVICKILLNFHIVSFAWIFFRSSNLDQSFMMIKSFFNFEFSSLNLGGSALDLCFGLACFGLVLVYDYFLFNKRKLFKPLGGIGIGSYWCKVTGASIIMVFGVFSQTEFLYFQF